MQEDEKRVMEFLYSQGLDRIEGATAKEVYDEICSWQSPSPDPESRAILNDSADRLSGNAKEVFRLIFDSPIELIEHVWSSGPKRWPFLPRLFNVQLSSLTQRDLRGYLRHCGWRHLAIKGVFDEIRIFLENI